MLTCEEFTKVSRLITVFFIYILILIKDSLYFNGILFDLSFKLGDFQSAHDSPFFMETPLYMFLKLTRRNTSRLPVI